jgi:hypothetical protein
VNVASQPTALSRAIDAYRAKPYVPGIFGGARLTRDDEFMLDCLRKSREAVQAFAAWELSDARSPFFIGDCVKARRYANGEHRKEVESWRTLPDPDVARDGLRVVAKYFGKAAALSTLGRDRDPVDEAIALLASQIRDEKRLRKFLRPATPRNGGEATSRSRAIGWLRDSIFALSGRPHYAAVREIAEVVLGLDAGTISEDAVKRALGPKELLDRRGR